MFSLIHRDRSIESNAVIGRWFLGLCLAVALSVTTAARAQEYTVNLKDTDIQEFIKFVADVTGSTIVVDPSVKGKVKVISSKPVSKADLYDLFLSILDVHGFTAVRSGGVIRVIPNKNARSSPVEVMAGTESANTDEYITQVIRLDNISAAKLIPVLRPLVPQQAHMAAYAPSNAIIISDIRSNINRIIEIIERMDRSAVQTTQVVKLRYGVAEDVVEMLKQLDKSQQGEGAEANEELTLIADKRTNSVVITADELRLQRIRELIEYLDTPLEQSGNVKVIYLDYANAKDVAEVLTRVMQNITRMDGDGNRQRASNSTSTIEADEGTNSLIITADTDEMAALEAVIARLDIRRAQVLVEAIIVEMDYQEGQELGIQWLFADNSGAFGSSIDGGRQAFNQGLGDAIRPPENGGNGDAPDQASLLGALAGTPGTTLGWGVVDEALTMTVILNALETQSNTNILSTPSLLTLDNEEASIAVGQEVPFVTGSFTNTGANNGAQNPFQTIQRQSVGINLTVTPHVNAGDAVVLDISQEVSSIAAALVASDVITNERKIETKVLAKDRDIIVLGGLVKDDLQNTEQRVPLLGDIPLLGRLFRNDTVNVTKQNLLVFIRPTVIRDDTDLAGATAEKYRYIREEQMERRARGMLYVDENRIPVVPTWEDQVLQLPEDPTVDEEDPEDSEG